MAKRCPVAMGVVFLMILVTVSAWAVPTNMNYQGKLTDKDGNPLSGTYNMTFYLFTLLSGGSALWSENHTDVAVTDGIYNVILGSINPLATGLFIGNDRVFLEVEIDGETFSPRQQLTSVPYALRARVADAVVDGAITTVMIEGGAVTTGKVANSSITGAKIASDQVTSAHISANAVGGSELADDAVTSAEIADGSIAAVDLAESYVNETGDTMTGPLAVTNLYLGTGFHHSIKGSLLGSSAVGAGVYGYTDGTSAHGVHGGATGTDGVGVYGEAIGARGVGVYGEAANDGPFINYGGYFVAEGKAGYAVYGYAKGTTHINGGGIFMAAGPSGRGVEGRALGASGTGVYGWATSDTGASKGVYGYNQSSDGYAGYFEGRGYFSDKVGIGTESPQYKLDVAGRARMRAGDGRSSGIWFMNDDNSQNRGFIGMESDDYLGFYGQGGASWGLVFNVIHGTVGIGTLDPGFFKLAVNGNAAKVGGGSWASYSDARLKDIGERYEHGLEEITKIEPVKYRYKEDNALGLPSDGEYVGLIAQEVEEVLPEAVEQNAQGYLMLNGDPINYAMLNAIKELSAEVKRLKKRIEELEKERR
jgi:hypothetical protein